CGTDKGKGTKKQGQAKWSHNVLLVKFGPHSGTEAAEIASDRHGRSGNPRNDLAWELKERRADSGSADLQKTIRHLLRLQEMERYKEWAASVVILRRAKGSDFGETKKQNFSRPPGTGPWHPNSGDLKCRQEESVYGGLSSQSGRSPGR